MTFADEIEMLYREHGSRHIQPFIGDAFRLALPGRARVAAVGINAYLSDKDWRDTEHARKDEVHGWFRAFWREEKHTFYKRGYGEVTALGHSLAGSELFTGLEFDEAPSTKPCLYATNAIKNFLEQELVDSTKLDPGLLAEHTETWRRELDAMAKHGVFPHVVVVFGALIWPPMWQVFHKDSARPFQHFNVTAYESLDSADPAYHHVNRLGIDTTSGPQSTLLVRVAHPSRPAQHSAKWLLGQPSFRTLARLPPL